MSGERGGEGHAAVELICSWTCLHQSDFRSPWATGWMVLHTGPWTFCRSNKWKWSQQSSLYNGTSLHHLYHVSFEGCRGQSQLTWGGYLLDINIVNWTNNHTCSHSHVQSLQLTLPPKKHHTNYSIVIESRIHRLGSFQDSCSHLCCERLGTCWVYLNFFSSH